MNDRYDLRLSLLRNLFRSSIVRICLVAGLRRGAPCMAGSMHDGMAGSTVMDKDGPDDDDKDPNGRPNPPDGAPARGRRVSGGMMLMAVVVLSDDDLASIHGALVGSMSRMRKAPRVVLSPSFSREVTVPRQYRLFTSEIEMLIILVIFLLLSLVSSQQSGLPIDILMNEPWSRLEELGAVSMQQPSLLTPFMPGMTLI